MGTICSAKSNNHKKNQNSSVPQKIISIEQQIHASKEDIKLLYDYEKTIGFHYKLYFSDLFKLHFQKVMVILAKFIWLQKKMIHI